MIVVHVTDHAVGLDTMIDLDTDHEFDLVAAIVVNTKTEYMVPVDRMSWILDPRLGQERIEPATYLPHCHGHGHQLQT